MRPLLLAMLAASALWAQFAEFAAPGDGSRLYFSSSLPLQESGEPVQGRIFDVDATGVHTVVDVPATTPSPFSSYYQLSRPELSRDGTILVYSAGRDCYGSTVCESTDNLGHLRQTTVIGLPSGALNLNGAGRISGNGRYLFLGAAAFGPAPSVLDLQTGQSQALSALAQASSGAGRVVADDGTVVASAGNVLYIAKGGAIQSIPFARIYAMEPVIDSHAGTVVYVQWDYYAYVHSIHAYSIAQQQDIALFTQGDSTAPFVSADGARVMFVSTASGSPQIWVANTDATSSRQVTSDLTGVLLAAMSDDGTTAWYLSGSGSVIQVDLNSGATQERISRTPSWSGSRPNLAPGAAWTLEGGGFSESTFTAPGYPLPQTLGGVSVSIGGISAPIVSVAPTQIVVQVPWEIPAVNFPGAPIPVIVTAVSASPFLPALTNSVSAWSGIGSFVYLAGSHGNYGDAYALAVHEDWSALVTSSNPAHANEILHLYGLNFGPVDTHPPDGMPAPVSPLARTITPITCWAWGADNVTKLAIPVLFSGLVPGMAGYYQLDVQLTSSNLRPDTQIVCSGSGYDGGFFGDVPVEQ